MIPILGNLGWLFVDRTVRMAGGLFIMVWLARYLGPDQFGRLNYAFAFAGLFGAVAGFELNGVVVRDLIRKPGSANETLGTAFVMQIFGGLIATGLIVTCIALLRPEDVEMHWMVAILGLCFVFRASDVVKYWFESRIESRYTVWVESGTFLTIAAMKVVMILQRAPLMGFIWIALAEAGFIAAGLLIMYDRKGARFNAWHWGRARARRLLKDSWPFILGGVAIMTYMRLDQIMLGEMLGPDAVGTYTAAVRISEVWYVAYVLIVSSVTPLITKARYQDAEAYRQRLLQLYRLLIVLSVLIAIPMSFLSAPLIQLLYGDAYAKAGAVLAIHVWAGIPVALGIASSQALLLDDLQLYSFYRTLFGCILNVVLNLVLIPPFGIVGSAMATVISFVAATFSLALFPRCRPIILMMIESILPRRSQPS